MQEAFRLFLRDSIEASVAVIAGLALTMPTGWDDAKRIATVAGVACLTAVVAVARRVLLPAILTWIYPKK